MTTARYRGRFAPSPTGPLHFGSLAAAVGSYLDARAHGGEWLLRIEDVDTPRTVPGAADAILHLLEALGFCWDGELVWQSRRTDRYREVLDALVAKGDVFPCACSRREIAESGMALSTDGGYIYPGTCRDGLLPERAARAWRLRVTDAPIHFEDRVQGFVAQNLAQEVGDFVLLRADGLFAYQLAVVVDDADAGVTDVVRGADLLDSTPRQLWLQRCLGVDSPRHAHLPVATNAAGEKWSKQTLAPAVAAAEGVPLLVRALRFLGQKVPDEVLTLQLEDFWSWAVRHWRIESMPRCRSCIG
jgi:glutamyl-Q tRNA(Asp) synthetase